MMKGIRLKKLFGYFNYTIEFASKGMVILTGPNGFGKSTIIKCIDAISNSDLNFFFELDFEEVEILKDNDSENLLIKKEKDDLFINGKHVDRRVVVYARRVQMRKYELVEEEPEMAQMMENYSYALECMQKAVGKVIYIKEQRLLREVISARAGRQDVERRRMDNQIIHVVQSIPEKLLFQIRKTSTEYSKVANELDSTYPERLFHQTEGIEKEEFDKRIAIMHEKVEKLNKYGISNINKLQNIEFRKEDARALKIYFEDFDKKYCEYEELIEKLELFTDMVNRRYRFKVVNVSNSCGAEVIDERGKNLDLLKLSSGEQETMVLFYRLLFEVPDNVMLLVDEPEISLHIAWQRMFAQDLELISKKKNLCAIIATHSPQIVNGNRDVQVDLGEMYKDGFNQRK